MTENYESALVEEFNQLNTNNFHVDLAEHLLFVCGGSVDASQVIPPSFRDRFVSYTESDEPDIASAIVLAEEFKDYFKDNIYSDLLMFEDDIASISSLIIIFLESPGSLVELGMFCSRPAYYKKLVIVAPDNEVSSEDSFIYLGPLEYINKKVPSSVAIYPWPDSKIMEYDRENIADLCDVIKTKLKKQTAKEEKFKQNDSGHLSILICEIISICNPILIGEIDLALKALGIDLTQKDISRHLYLLTKVGLIKQKLYSNYRYYYVVDRDKKRIRMGVSKKKKPVDILKIKMSIRKSFVLSEDSASKKRKTVQKIIEGGGK